MAAIQGVTILFRANSHVILTLPYIWGMSGREELCRCFGCARWVCQAWALRVVRACQVGVLRVGVLRVGVLGCARWGGEVRVPDEDSPYRPRNLL